MTSSIVWNIDFTRGGLLDGRHYTASKAGNWAVTATLGNLASFTTLNVTHAPAQSILVTPQTALINAGCSQVFSSTAFDLYNNSWDVSTLASWSINSSALGSWSAGNYTSANMGNWTVTADYSGIESFSELTVYYPDDLNQDGKVNFADIQYFVHVYEMCSQTGVIAPNCDLNHDGKLNFHDIQVFVNDFVLRLTYTGRVGQGAVKLNGGEERSQK